MSILTCYWHYFSTLTQIHKNTHRNIPKYTLSIHKNTHLTYTQIQNKTHSLFIMFITIILSYFIITDISSVFLTKWLHLMIRLFFWNISLFSTIFKSILVSYMNLREPKKGRIWGGEGELTPGGGVDIFEHSRFDWMVDLVWLNISNP